MAADPFEGCSVQGPRITRSNGETFDLVSEPERIEGTTGTFRAMVRRGAKIQVIQLPANVVLAWEMAGAKLAT